MPRGDRTEPGGLSPMTARAAGYCIDYPVPGFIDPYGGRLDLGFGYTRGFVSGYVNPIPLFL